ncbi:MAG TPA: HlyD family efflux transporter periplasmic adaptor subunit [Lacipirellula sp.]
MADANPTDAPAASWLQLEHSIERLHAAARSPMGVREFYRRLLAEAIAATGAVGGAAWLVEGDGHLQLACQSLDADVEAELGSAATRRDALLGVLQRGEAEICALDTGRATKSAAFEGLVCPVAALAVAEDESDKPPAAADQRHAAVFELWLPTCGSALVKQGWLELAATIADVASDFHALDELRRLREGAALHREAIGLLKRVQTPRDLVGAAHEVANEGRRVLGCDRMCVVIRRGNRWRLLAASGAARIERRSEFARRIERVAQGVAQWGEPVQYPPGSELIDLNELPPTLARVVEEHVDYSHARELAAAPTAFEREASNQRRRVRFDLVLVAENFEAGGSRGQAPRLALPLVELGELCGPALGRAAALDRFPLRALLRWSDRLAALRQPARLLRAVAIAGAIAAAVAALVYVPADFDVEAPATLRTVVERDVFATATGSVAELHAEHGQLVAKGDVLVVLSDPELALKLQQVRGEIDAARKRLDALAVTRTERTLRENGREDRLPLSAEQRQLEEQLASLNIQRELLQSRREALSIRSPIDGQVLTRDVATLLESRPVERGEVLLTVADASSGWQIIADVPQRHIGHVLEAQRDTSEAVEASYRLVGDVEATFPGRVVDVSAAAPLEAEGLEDEAPPVEVRIAVEGAPPAAARPGMSATVRIHCGERALGYVWLHDVAATIYRWVTF